MSTGPIGVILAAGASSRMGAHKALLSIDETPLVVAHAAALSAVCSRVIVVLGAQADTIATHLPAWVEIIINPDWATTQMSDSLQLALHEVDGLVITTPVDVPPAPVTVLQALLDTPLPAVVHFEGKPGHPVAFEAHAMHRALDDSHLSDALAHANATPTQWAGCLQSWNTPEEWAARAPHSGPRPLPS